MEIRNNQVAWARVARSSFQGRTFGQCACLYAWVRLVVHLW